MESIEQTIAILDLHFEEKKIISVDDHKEIGRFLLSNQRPQTPKLIEALKKLTYLQIYPISLNKKMWKSFESN